MLNINKQNNEVLGQKVLFNSNVLLKDGPALDSKTFAEQFSLIRKQQDDSQLKQVSQINNAEISDILNNQSQLADNPELLAKAKELIEKHLKEQGLVKEKVEQLNTDANKKDVEELANKYTNSEANMAVAAQANQKTITDALKEGNLAEQQAQHDNTNDRRQQLTKWAELAPTIMEDVKNKAVRIDIPGITDIQTVIVRMIGNKNVAIHAIGSDSAMKSLQNSRGKLQASLSEHDINLAELSAYNYDQVKGIKK